MQQRRRRTKQMRTDNYSPKDKANVFFSKPLLIILAIIAGSLLLFILYKMFASPATVETDQYSSVRRSSRQSRQSQQKEYNQEEEEAEVQSRSRGQIPPRVPMMDKMKFPPNINMDDLVGNQRKSAFANGARDKIREKRERYPGSRGDNNFDRPPISNIDELRERHNIQRGDRMPGGKPPPGMERGFGDLGNLRGVFDKHGGGGQMMDGLMGRGQRPNFNKGGPPMRGGEGAPFGRVFDRNGDGPIMNDLNKPGGGKLTPQQLQDARDKLRSGMRGMGGAPDLDEIRQKLPGFERFQGRKEES